MQVFLLFNQVIEQGSRIYGDASGRNVDILYIMNMEMSLQIKPCIYGTFSPILYTDFVLYIYTYIWDSITSNVNVLYL